MKKLSLKSGCSILIAVFGAALPVERGAGGRAPRMAWAADKHLIHLITETGLIPGFFHLHGMPDIVAA